jgi:XTP/dITP diphosphohydrolase
MPIVFATNNAHKIKEVRSLLPPGFSLLTLKDIDCDDELPETGNSFQANASQKATYVYEKFGVDCFADDSGLEVNALRGEPGVHSARYAGPRAGSEENVTRLLYEMKGITDRSARFRTVIALIRNGEQHFFEGIINGTIAESAIGSEGFGYDPVFIPENSTKTFAEMTPEEKNAISHRAIAIKKLVVFLLK